MSRTTTRTTNARSWRASAPRSWLSGLLAVAGLAFGPISDAEAQTFAGAEIAPSEAIASLRFVHDPDVEAWTELALDAIDAWQASVRPGWAAAEAIRERLVPAGADVVHAVGPGGRRWIQAFRWSDPTVVETGLRALGSRPMGGGRFRLPAQGLDLALADDWLVLVPVGGGDWLDFAVDRVTGWGNGRMDRGERLLLEHMERAPLEVSCRLADPIGGLMALGIRPTGPDVASIEFHGRFNASPWPIRPAGRLEIGLVRHLDGRVAGAMLESGVGLLDPMLVEAAPRIPELVPEAALRRRFAGRRLLVVDGEPVDIDPIGLVEVPAVCVAIPMQGGGEPARDEAEVDDWLTTAGTAVRSTWTEALPTLSRTRGEEIRHFSLQPGILAATNQHPMALAASLNWTVRESTAGVRWLVVGSSPGLVRRVALAVTEAETVRDESALASCGIASPTRMSLQLRELAQIRGMGRDPQAVDDADALATVAAMLGRIDRIGWTTTVQDARTVRGRAQVRLHPSDTGGSPR